MGGPFSFLSSLLILVALVFSETTTAQLQFNRNGLQLPFMSSFKPLRPHAIPLAVRTPYLSAWAPGGSIGNGDGYLNQAWPKFWTGTVSTGTSLTSRHVLKRIDVLLDSALGGCE